MSLSVVFLKLDQDIIISSFLVNVISAPSQQKKPLPEAWRHWLAGFRAVGIAHAAWPDQNEAVSPKPNVISYMYIIVYMYISPKRLEHTFLEMGCSSSIDGIPKCYIWPMLVYAEPTNPIWGKHTASSIQNWFRPSAEKHLGNLVCDFCCFTSIIIPSNPRR